MNVLSLFDGISCGQIALKRTLNEPFNYYASEIDKFAIKVTQQNHPNTIQLGDVTKVNSANLPKIDLLIGGSPCQGFSFAGKELNFNDPRSALFFEFVRLLKETSPQYFLLENVVMKKEYQDVISSYLGVQPVLINSVLVSAQNRNRLYWTNIPNITQPDDKNIQLYHVLEKDNNFKAGRMVGRRLKNGKRCDHDKSIPIVQRIEINKNPNKSNCLTTVAKDNILVNGDKFRYFTPLEYERLQTVPDNYTIGVSDSQRLKMLGNGWTVDVISHILKNIT
jgi:site-specific DNA-cytosine methylase